MIDSETIDAIGDWVDAELRVPDYPVEKWFAARDVDEEAVVRHATRCCDAAADRAAQGFDARAVFSSLFVLGFQMGLEAECRRRNKAELPW